MAIIKYKDKDGNLVPLGASGDHTHSPESIGAAKKDHGHNVATEDSDGFMSSADKATIAELNDAVFGNDNSNIAGLVDLVSNTPVSEQISVAAKELRDEIATTAANTKDAVNKYTDGKITDLTDGAPGTLDTLGKVATAMAKNTDDIEALDKAVDGRALAEHPHIADDITDLDDVLNTKVPTTRTVNGKALSDDIELSFSDVGASKEGHDHNDVYYTESEINTKFNSLVGEQAVSEQISASISKLIKALSVSGTTITYTMVDGTTGTIKTQDTDTTYNVMTGASSSANGASGLVPQPTKGNQSKFLRADGTWQTPYTHPTTAGNKHIPSGGASGQFLKWSADGTATWASAPTITVDSSLSSTSTNPVQNNVIYTALSGKASSSHGNHVPTTQTADNAVFLRNDNTWQTVTPENIGAAAHKVMSSTDFNTMKQPGIYTMEACTTNVPNSSSSTYYSLIVTNSDDGTSGYIHQIAISEGTHDAYLRYCNSGTWSSWKRLALAEEVGGSSMEMESGTGSLDVQSNNTNFKTIYFDKYFSSAPTVVATITGATADFTECNIVVQSTTASSFTVLIGNHANSAVTANFNWIAVGS